MSSRDLEADFKLYFQMFQEVFDYSEDLVLPICINDSGCWYNDVVNIADFKDRCDTCMPFAQYFSEQDHDEKCKQLQKLGEEPYIHDKLLWIGSAHVNGADVRKEFCKIKNDRLVNINTLTSDVRITHADHTKYRYLIDLEGGFLEKAGYSARIARLLHMKRLLFFQDRPLYSFICSRLEPWVHFVPVKRDLSDLFEQIEWADSHPIEVAKIIENMTNIAPTKQDVMNQIKKVIIDYKRKISNG